MPKNRRKPRIYGNPYEYASTEGFYKSRELNRQLELEAAQRNADRRRAAEEKVAEELRKRKNEMSEEEYRKALSYIDEAIEDDNNNEPETTPGSYSDAVSKLFSGASVSTKWQAVGSSIVNAITGALENKEKSNRRKEREKFFDLFTPDAFSKAQQKYDPIQKVPEVSGALTLASLPIDTTLFAIKDSDLAQVQKENTDSQKLRTQLYKELTKPDSIYLSPSQDVVDSMNDRSKFLADTLERRNFESKVNEELYGTPPEGWGVSAWWSDAKTQYLINMNQAQKDDFAGRKVAAKEMLLKVDEAVYRMDCIRLLEWYDSESKKRNLTREELQDIENLKYEIAHLEDSAKYVQDMTPDGFFLSTLLGINQTISELIDKYIPKDISSGFANDVDVLRLKLLGLKNITDDKSSRDFKRYFHNAVNEKMKEWQEGIDANEKDIQRISAQHKISDYFKYKEQNASGIFDPETWFYKQPGLVGSSQSAWLKQGVAMGLNVLTSFLAPEGKLAGNIARGAIGAGISMPTAMSASESENYAEVLENYKSSLKNKLYSLGLADKFVKGDKNAQDIDQAVENFVYGKYIPSDVRIMQAAANATYGTNALFKDDMAATTMDDMLDTSLLLVPFGIAAKYLKASKGVVNRAGQARDAFFTGTAVGGPIAGLGLAVGRTAFGQAIDKTINSTARFMKQIPLKLLGKSKYKTTAEFFGRKSIPHKVLSPKAYVQYQTVKDFGKTLLSRQMKSGISEGIEEGKQYEHGQQFAAGEYRDSGYKGIFSLETMLNDFTAGLKTAYVMAGMLPFIPATTDDKQLIENIEGGILGGLFQTGAQITATATPSLVSLMKVNHFVAKQALYEKAQQRDAYEKYKMYAKKAGDATAIQRMNAAFQMYKDAVRDGNRETTPDVMVQMINEQQDKFNNIVALADSEFLKTTAEQLGITSSTKLRDVASKVSSVSKYTDRYRQFVAAIGMLQDAQEESQSKYNEISDEIRNIINLQNTPFRLDGGNVILDKINRITNQKIAETVNPIQKEDGEISGEQLLDLKNREFRSNTELFVNISVLKKLIDEVNLAIIDRKQVNGATKDLLFTRDRLKFELQRNLDRIRQDRKKDVLDNVDKMLSDITDLDNLKQLIRQRMLARTELDYHQAVLGGVLGEYGKPEEGSEEASRNLPYSTFNANDVIDAIEKASEEDYKLQENIEKDWLSNFTYRSKLNYDEQQKKLNDWRKKTQEKEQKIKAAATKTVTVTQDDSSDEKTDENGGAIETPESTFGAEELLPEVEKPTGSVADNAKPANNYTEPQNKSINALADKRIQDMDRMEVVDPATNESSIDRTGHDYFIRGNDGKVRMFGRVHSYLDRQYPVNQQEKESHDKKVQELKTLWNKRDKKAFEDKVKEYETKYEAEFKDYPGFRKLNLQRYLDYLNDGNESEIDDIIEAIAELSSTIPADASVVIGEAIDKACRIFFSTGELPYEEVAKWMNEDVYNDFVRQLKNIKAQYDILGWELIAEPQYFYTEIYDNRTGRVRKVAGETDMIAVDREGKYHIIDFKTSKNKFYDQYGPGGQKLFNPFTDLKSDKALNDTRVQVRTTKEYYVDQQSMYTIMLQDNLDEAIVASRELLPFTVGWNKEYVTNNTSLGQSVSARISGEKPIESIKNEMELTDPATHEFIIEPDGGKVKMGVQRIPLDMSLTIAERFLDKNDQDSIEQRLSSIMQSSPVDFYYDMPQEDKNKLKSATIGQILTLADEYNDILDIILSEMFDGTVDKLSIIARAENVIARLQQIQRVAETEIVQYDTEESLKNDVLPFPEVGLVTDNQIQLQQLEPSETFLQLVNTQIRDQIEQLEILASDVKYLKYNSPDGVVGGDALTAASQLISNIQELMQKYPSNFTQEQQNDFAQLLLFFQEEMNFLTVQTAPNVVDESTAAAIEEDWKSITTTWKGTFGDSVGIEDAVAEDGSKLLDVTADPEFVTDATFELVMKRTSGSRGKSVDRVHVIVHYKGKTYTPVSISTANTMQGRIFYNTVRMLVSKNPGKRIIIRNTAVSRSNGRIRRVDRGSLVDQGIINESNMYDISYNSTQTQFGIAKKTTDPITNFPITLVLAPGETSTQARTLFTWTGDNTPEAGMLVMMTEPVQNEQTSLHNRIPLVINESYLSEDDAQLVLDILTLQTIGEGKRLTPIQALDEEFTENENGLFVRKGLTNRQVLNLLIPYGPSRKIGRNRVFLSFSPDPNGVVLQQNKIYVHGRIKGDPVNQAPREFDITTEQGRQAFKKFLTENVSINIDEDVMSSRILLASNKNGTPFSGLNKIIQSEYGQKRLREGKAITFGKSRIKFDAKDIQNPNDRGDTLGVSGLVWYARCGMILSEFGGFENTLLKFDDSVMPEIEQESPEMPKAKSAEEAVQKQNEAIFSGESTRGEAIDNKLDDSYSIDNNYGEEYAEGVWDKIVKDSKQDFDEKEAREHLRKVLGDNIPIEVKDAFIDVLASGATVVGRTYSDAILLSRMGERGVEWHEAFHRILEILASDKTRERIYMAYLKAVDDYTLTDHEIGERLADQFMMYMMNKPAMTLKSLKHPFQLVKSWYNLYKSIGNFELFAYYTAVNMGAYRNIKADPKRADKFKKLYPNGRNMTIGGVGFDHILNQHMYKELKKTLVLILLQAQNLDPAGRNIQDLQIDDKIIRHSPIYKSIMMSDEELRKQKLKRYSKQAPLETRLALEELVDKWDTVAGDIASDISQFSTDYTARYESEQEEDADGGEAASASIAEHIRASYEFSQFSRTSSRVRFFFSRIPKSKYVDGKLVQELNEFGLPTYYDAKYIFNYVLNQCHDINSKNDLVRRLYELGKTDPIFRLLHQRVARVWGYNMSKISAGDQQLMTQIYNSIKTAKNAFVVGKSIQNGDYFSVVIQSTDTDYNAQKYKKEWSKLFAAGASLYLEIGPDGKPRMKNGYKPEIFTQLANKFKQIVDCFSDETENPIITIKGLKIKFDKTNFAHVEMAKRSFIQALQSLGIQFDYDQLNFMLSKKPYGDTGFKGMQKLLHQTGTNDIAPFIRMLNQLNYKGKLNIDEKNRVTYVDQRGRTSVKSLDNIFVGAGAGFISMLSTAKYNYRTAHDQLQVLATHGNKYYVMSENNVINDITDIINRATTGAEEELIEEIKLDVYNYYHPEDPNMIGNTPEIGSLIIKKISSDVAAKKGDPNYKPDPVQVVTLAGFKTDEKGDQGNDYAEISLREDYVTKSAILLDGGLLFPTMSDKKTWVYLKGIQMPGIDHHEGYLSQTLNSIDKDGYFTQLDTVAEQFLEYAQTEYMSVKRTIVQARNLSDSEKVKNFHKASVKIKKGDKEIKIPIVQGGRFTSMLGVYDFVEENGKIERKFIEFNRVLDEKGNIINEEDNLKIAEDHFFLPQPKRDGAGNILVDANGQPLMETAEEMADRQKRQIAEVLQHQLVEELKYIELIGLIKRRPVSTTSSLMSYLNVGLDNVKIEAIARALAKGATWESLTIRAKEDYKALALSILVNDMMVKHIMSLQEVERIYAGNPAFFKFGYDNEGHLVDRSIDQLKRFGGLVSTGQPNDLLQDVPTTYSAAEVDNEMVEAANIESLHELMVSGQIRSTYLRQLLDEKGISIEDEDGAKECAKEADTLPLDEIRKKLDPTALKIAERIAEKKTNSFRMGEYKGKNYGGIDVADGGAYVTDEMAENMLKMVGSYDETVQKAFEILRDPSQVHSIREKADAYNTVWTTVIGTQKYTAYGFRHQNGVQVPYYNKMALFPLFKCMCTGNMAKIYEKMKSDKIDMLMVNSAVKVGSQGSKAITDWDNFEKDFHFNKYTQKFQYLRKQFNTDPKEEELMNVGTQMKKVAMSAIMPGRDYTTLDGRTLSAKAIRDEIMDSINGLSDLGLEAIRKEFFSDGELDVEKFSKFLTEELQGRGASREMLDAVSIVDENSIGISEETRERIKRTGKKELKVPLVALSNMNWIQSIIVSRVNSKVVDTSTPGKAFIQRSVWAMEGRTSVLNDDNLPEDLNDGNPLKMVNEEGSMDCVLSIDFFDHLLPKKIVGYQMKDGEYVLNKKGNRIPIYQKLSFEEARKYLIENGIIGPKAHANMVGYRIPTQAISSIHALRCVDVIPVVRDTIILPKEFTKITGSDFDIDKIFLSMKAYQKVDGKLTDKHDNGTAEFHLNRLLDDYIALLCDFIEDEKGNKTTRSMHMLHASIDNDTSLIEDVIDDLQESGHKNPLNSYDAYTLRHMCRAKDDFITGKTGIGPYALNNNSQVLTTLYEVEFEAEKSSIMTRLGLNSLHNQFDKDGESIMSWLSGLINIHVDVAKDPKHNKLNINGYTHNLVNLLIRTGFGKNTFYFTTQPIMKELATIINNASGKYMLEKGVSLSKLKKNAEQAFIMNIARANGIKGKTFGAVMQNWEQGMHDRQIGINATIDWLLQEGADVMRQIAKSGEGIDSKTTYKVQTLWNGKPHTEILSMFDVQMLMYRAFKQFTPYAEALSNLVKYSKIDTKKHGKNLLEQKKYMQGYHAMFDDNSQDKSRMLFKADGLQRLRDKTYIGRMTENAIGVFSDIMGTQVIQGTDKFIDRDGCMDAVLAAIGRYGSTDDQLLKSVSGAILAKKKSEFFNKWAQDNEIDIKGLVDGNDTIFNRLCKLKSELICVDKYRGLLDSNGNIKNYMLRTLVAGYTHDFSVPASAPYGTMTDDYKSVKFITTLNFLDDESIDQDEFTQSWEDLLNDTRYPELQKFARDLIMYAFITAGDNGGRNDIMKFIPNSWKIESGYVDHMVNVLDKFNDNKFTVDSTLSIEEIEDIILNNWYDDNYIHTVNVKNVREFFSKVKQPDGKVRQTEYATVIGLPSSSSIESEFIKIPRPNIGDHESQRRYVLYKRIGFGKHEQLFERMINGKPTMVTDVNTYPIYVAVEPRGNRFADRSLILSYGRNESSRESLTNMCLDALAFKLLVDIGVKVQNTEQAFAELSAIFHETDPAITKYMKGLYDSSILDVIEEYNSYKYAAFIDDSPVNAPGAVPFPSVNYYTGMIVPDDNTIFVFGSNPEGRHGAGAAKTAKEKFGAIYGQGEGLQGSSYALPTKDLRVKENRGFRSISPEQITENIRKMYDVARQNPDKQFKVAYTNNMDETSLNGYTGREMLEMFKNAGPVPSNVLFSEVWARHWDDFTLPENKDEAERRGESVFLVPEGIDNTMSPINIYAGSDENTELSNMANRPFVIDGFAFNSVEQGFHTAKLQALRHILLGVGSKAAFTQIAKINGLLEQLKNAKDAYAARSIGRTKISSRSKEVQDYIDQFFGKDEVNLFGIAEWNRTGTRMMERMIRESFEQNPEALQKLLDTGNAPLTHNNKDGVAQDVLKGKESEGSRFANVLTKVRNQFIKEKSGVVSLIINQLKNLGIPVHNRAELIQYLKDNNIDLQSFIGKKARQSYEEYLRKNMKLTPDDIGYRLNGVSFKADHNAKKSLTMHGYRVVEETDWDNNHLDYEIRLKGATEEEIQNLIAQGLIKHLNESIPTFKTAILTEKGESLLRNEDVSYYTFDMPLYSLESTKMQEEGLVEAYRPYGSASSALRLTEKGIKQSTLSYTPIDEALDFLHHLEDNKENTAYIKTAVRWLANGSIQLPRDHEKAKQAFDVARKHNIDVLKYKTLGDLISSPEMFVKKDRPNALDPDDATTFTNKRTVRTESGRVFTVYDVENSEKGQEEVCRVLFKYYKTSPWCLSTFTNTGKPTSSAKHFWNRYNAIPRKIAFENGRPVAFSSSSKTEYTNIDGSSNVGSVYIGGKEYTLVSVNGNYALVLPNDVLNDLNLVDSGLVDTFEQDGKRYIERGYYNEQYPNVAILNKKGVSRFGNQMVPKNDREGWWDLLDTHELKSLSDSINGDYSKIEYKGEPLIESDMQFEIDAAEFDQEPHELEPDEITELEFLNYLRDAIKSVIDLNLSLILTEDAYNPDFVKNQLADIYIRELNYNINEIRNIDVEFYEKILEIFLRNNFENHVRETISDYYNNRMPVPAAPQGPVIDFDEDLPFFTTHAGEVYGFVTPEGEIYLDETIIDAEHPIHEYTHIWDRVVAQKNPTLWKQGVELMKKTTKWKEIAEHPQYGQKWAKIQGITQAQLDNMIASEVHARFVGEGSKANVETISKEQGSDNILSKLAKWFEDFWKTLKDTFSEWSGEDLSKLTLKQFNHMPLRDFAKGVQLDKNLMKSKNSQFIFLIYKDTAQLKSAIVGQFVVNRLNGGIGTDAILVGIQTESEKNGKYITVIPQKSSDYNEVLRVLKDLQNKSNMDIQLIEHKGKILVSRDSYKPIEQSSQETTRREDSFGQYNLRNDFTSEALRMLAEDPELFNEYVSQLGREQMESCGII